MLDFPMCISYVFLQPICMPGNTVLFINNGIVIIARSYSGSLAVFIVQFLVAVSSVLVDGTDIITIIATVSQ